MSLLLRGASVFRRGRFERLSVSVDGKRIAKVASEIVPGSSDQVFDLQDTYLIPGFADVHVHLREPGFSYKETIKTGTEAALRGGYSALCTMPNVQPAPDCVAHLKAQLDIIERDARVRVYPIGAITRGQQGRGELVDFEAMSPLVCAFSDDGRGVQEEETMLMAMRRVAAVGGMIAAHCEDEAQLFPGGAVHDGAMAAKLGLTGIHSKSEWGQLERDLRLVEQTRCRYHMCHVSTKESVALIREAKRRGLPVSAETAPHYLLLTDEDIEDDGRFKMNPPIREREDQNALLEGILDGTIDLIATDHAPHSKEEKAKGLRHSLMGIVGLETSFAVLNTRLVKAGVLPMETLVERMSVAPRRVFGLGGGEIEEGQIADLTVLDTETRCTIDPEGFASKARSTPFAGWDVRGRIYMTLVDGEVRYAVSDHA